MLDNNVFSSCTHLIGGGDHTSHCCIDRITDITGNINAGMIGGNALERVGAVAEA
ncbi:hypothetical protein D3C75_1330310 [compost metagenome]